MPILKKRDQEELASTTSGKGIVTGVAGYSAKTLLENKLADLDTEVFVLEPGSKLFLDYDEYLDQVSLYSQPIWTCRLTGRSHMTFWQAWESEQKAERSLESFPDIWKPYILSWLQHSTDSSETFATKILEFSKNNYIVGEIVRVDLESTSFHGKIISANYQPGQSDATDPTEYRVVLIDQDTNEEVGEAAFVGNQSFMRLSAKPLLNKALIKRFIKSVATKLPFPGSPWIVNHDLAVEYNLPTELPPHLAEKVNLQMNLSKPALPSTENELELLEHPVPPPPSYTFPMEDLDLPQEKQTGPIPFLGYPVDKNIQGDDFTNALTIWSFLRTFYGPLSLSPFSFDDWIASLQHQLLPNPILEASHAVLLQLAAASRKISPTSFTELVDKIRIYAESNDGSYRELDVDAEDKAMIMMEEDYDSNLSQLDVDGVVPVSPVPLVEQQQQPSSINHVTSEKEKKCPEGSIIEESLGDGKETKLVDDLQSNLSQFDAITEAKLKELTRIKWYEPPKSMPWWKQVLGFIGELVSLNYFISPFEQFNLVPIITELAERDDEIVRTHTGNCAYLDLKLSSKLAILGILVNLAIQDEGIKEFIDEAMEDACEAKKTRRFVDADKNRVIKEMIEIERELDLLRAELDNEAAQSQLKAIQREIKNKEGSVRKLQHEEHRLEKKSKNLLREEKKHHGIRIEPLGQDRYYRNYWWFDKNTKAGEGAICGKLYVEDVKGEMALTWHFYDEKVQIEKLIESLNPLGIREYALRANLQKYLDQFETCIRQSVNNPARVDNPVKTEGNENKEERMADASELDEEDELVTSVAVISSTRRRGRRPKKYTQRTKKREARMPSFSAGMTETSRPFLKYVNALRTKK